MHFGPLRLHFLTLLLKIQQHFMNVLVLESLSCWPGYIVYAEEWQLETGPKLYFLSFLGHDCHSKQILPQMTCPSECLSYTINLISYLVL